MTEREIEAPPPQSALRGIGGWLAVVVVQLVLSDLYYLRQVADRASLAIASGKHGGEAVLAALFSPIGLLFMAVNLVLLRLFQRRKETRLLLIIFYGVNAAAVGAMWIGYAGGYAWATKHVVPLYPFPFMLSLAESLALLGYVQSSERVKNTFVLEAPPKAGQAEPKGLGGALLIPIGFTVLMGAAAATAMMRNNVPARMVDALLHGHPAVLLRLGLACAFLGFVLLTLAGTLQKRRHAVWLMLALFLIVAAVAAVGLLFPEHFHHNARGATVALFGAAGCATYILTSKRVKNTFVH